jgi:hypothetical protein
MCASHIHHPGASPLSLAIRASHRTVERCLLSFGPESGVGADSGLARDLAEGRVVFDGAAAAACAAQAGDGDPFLPFHVAEACLRVFVGTVPLGNECDGHNQCAGFAYCASSSNTCPGICTARKPLGETCHRDVECEQRVGYAGCDLSTSPGTCTTIRYVHGGLVGEPCSTLVVGERRLCTAPLYCDEPSPGDGVCRAPAEAGEACTPGQPCTGTTYCLGNRLCEEVTLVTQVGEACAPGIGTRICDNTANLFCRDGQCVLAGDGSENNPCRVDRAGSGACNAGFYCAPQTQTCVPKKVPGQACSTFDECFDTCDIARNNCTTHSCRL